MDVFEAMKDGGFDSIIHKGDKDTGLKMIIALHDLTLGSALGGIRFYPYESLEDAQVDVMRLARGMTYKNAIIYHLSDRQLSHGGGKAVIIGDPLKDKTRGLLIRAADAINDLGGKYIGGEDMGMNTNDVGIMFERTEYITGLKETHGRGGRRGSGDPSPVTALGVFEGIRECLSHRFGTYWMGNKRFAIQGVGNVGKVILNYLTERGAKIIATDAHAQPLQIAKFLHPEIEVLEPEKCEEIYDHECDVFVPCAVGGIINDETIERLANAGVKIIAGCANNQLLEPRHGEELWKRGILYAPDYVINAGGAINVAVELEPFGYNHKLAQALARKIGPLLAQIFRESKERNISPEKIADEIAEKVLGKAKTKF